tara:strand:+ start:379 stop:624 length:246 start_codon:yes stop_codon:yes gene_type:complete
MVLQMLLNGVVKRCRGCCFIPVKDWLTKRCSDARKWEKVLHSMFKHKRLPQSEWFDIAEEEALPKINWLAAQTNQSMVVGE